MPESDPIYQGEMWVSVKGNLEDIKSLLSVSNRSLSIKSSR